MKKNLTMTLLGALAFMAGCTSQPEGVPVTLNVAEKGASVSPRKTKITPTQAGR